MLRRYHRFFQSLLLLRDAGLVALSFWGAYACRAYLAGGARLPGAVQASPQETTAVGLMLALGWPAAAAAGGLYGSRRASGAWRDVRDVVRTTAVAFFGLVTLTYFVREARYSRGVLLLWVALCVPLLCGARLAARAVLGRLRGAGYNLRHVLVVGAGPHATKLTAALQGQAPLGLRVVGQVTLQPPARARRARAAGAPAPALAPALALAPDVAVPELGHAAQLADIVARCRVDQVLVALAIDQLGALPEIMATLCRATVDVRLVPDFYQYVTLCGSVEEFAGLPIINLQATPLAGWNRVLKRLFDLAAALAGLCVLAPLLAALALAIRASSRGPVFFRQERVGLDGRRFAMLKFRTMLSDAESAGAQMAVRGDPRCTRLGRWLRRLSLDELPQLLNVLRGEMSLVGPRPERPCFIDAFAAEMPRYALRHKIKAGMTGWAQVHGLRGNTSMARRLELDLFYIEHWSLWLDLKILVRTVLGGFLSPHAY